MATKLQIRRDTAANWASANPVLSSGELGFETDTYKLKIGDGSSAWNSLAYYDDQISGLDSAAAIGLLGNGTVQHIIPSGTELYDLGSASNKFRDLYLSGNTLNLGDATLSADSSGALTLPSTIKIGETTLTSTGSGGVSIGDSGGAILDSAAVLGFINAAYIQSNQITYNNNDFADSAFVTSQINNLIDGAPGTLDTLNEIAAALNDDAAAYDTLLSLINAKSDLDSAAVTNLIDSSYIQLRRPAETIMTVTGDGANYYFVGDGFPSTSSGDPTLYLSRGKTYRFENIPGSHPFEIRQSSGGSAYSTGVTNNGGSGTVIFTVPMDAPTSLVYQCTVHSGMVGNIVILDDTAGSGVDSAAVTALIDSAYVQARQTSGGSGTVDSAQVISIINNNTNSGFVWYSYTATQGQTTFQDSDNSGKVLSYDPDGIAVFYNGVLLTPNDFTASDQSSVVLGTAADAGENIAIFKWGVGYVAPDQWYGDRGIFAGGSGWSNVMQYIDINTPSNTTDFGDLTASRGERPAGWGDGTYAVYGGGRDNFGSSNVIDYVTVATPSNASDFGDLTSARRDGGDPSNATRGLYGGGYESGDLNIIDYITIATPSNAIDFGDLAYTRRGVMPGMDLTYALFAASGNTSLSIDYVLFDTPGNSTDFGDLTVGRITGGGVSDQTRTLFGGGQGESRTNTIDYVTTATPSNATDFGDLRRNKTNVGSLGNSTYAVWAGGYSGSNQSEMDYVTIQTTSNYSDFGDLVSTNSGPAGASGSPS